MRVENGLIDHMSVVTANFGKKNEQVEYNSNCKIVVELQPEVGYG